MPRARRPAVLLGGHVPAELLSDTPPRQTVDDVDTADARGPAVRGSEKGRVENAGSQRRPRSKSHRRKPGSSGRPRRPAPRQGSGDAARDAQIRELLTDAKSWLGEAGLRCAVSGDLLVVEGVAFPPPKDLLRRGRAKRWLDELVMEEFRSHLLRTLRDNLDDITLVFALRLGRRGVALMRDGDLIAGVTATGAVVGAQRIRGNFLTYGLHWLELREAILAATTAAPRLKRVQASAGRPARTPVQRPAAVAVPPTRPPVEGDGYPQVHTAFPDTLDPGLVRLAMDASRRLREDRAIVFEHPVELEFSGGSLRLEPLRFGDAGSVRLPLRWGHDQRTITAALRLTTPADPLAFVLLRGDPGSVGDAWVTTLIAYADLTCVEVESGPKGPRDDRLPRSGQANVPRTARRIDAATSASRTGLVPVGRTADWMASYVAGHRRRLRPGQRASEPARRNAARYAIRLRPDETWVQPHVRGIIPADAVLRFRWTPPERR